MDKRQIESSVTIVKQISRQSVSITSWDYRFNTFMDFEQNQGSGWLAVSELVGTYHRRWSFDLHIFHDKDKEKVSHLNIHHTVNTTVVPNIKATFSSL